MFSNIDHTSVKVISKAAPQVSMYNPVCLNMKYSIARANTSTTNVSFIFEILPCQLNLDSIFAFYLYATFIP